MKNLAITAATFTVLLAGQTAMADAGGHGSKEFLGWINNSNNAAQVDQSVKFNKESTKYENNVDDSYEEAKNDIYSIHFMSDK